MSDRIIVVKEAQASPASKAMRTSLDREGAGAQLLKEQRRDANGRFVKAGRKTRPPRLRKAGIRGPTYYADKSPLALARLVLSVEAEVGRLKAEEQGEPWSDPERRADHRLAKRREGQTELVRKRLDALDLVLDDLATARVPRDTPKMHEEIAGRVARKLGEPFSWRTLYRKPYFGRWKLWRKKPTTDWIGREQVDDAAPTLAEVAKLGRRRLVFSLRKLSAERNALVQSRRTALAADAVADSWEPIPQED